jgi:hypothetical protein
MLTVAGRPTPLPQPSSSERDRWTTEKQAFVAAANRVCTEMQKRMRDPAAATALDEGLGGIGDIAPDECEKPVWDESDGAIELRETAPVRRVGFAVVLDDLDFFMVVDAALFQADLIREPNLMARLARPLKDVLEDAKKLDARGRHGKLLQDLTRHCLGAGLAEIDPTCNRNRHDLARLGVVVIPDENPIPVADDGCNQRADLVARPRRGTRARAVRDIAPRHGEASLMRTTVQLVCRCIGLAPGRMPLTGPMQPSKNSLRTLERKQILIQRIDAEGNANPQVLKGDTREGWAARDYIGRVLRTTSAECSENDGRPTHSQARAERKASLFGGNGP